MYIATELVVPLVEWLALERDKVKAKVSPDETARAAQSLQLHCLWGLAQILRALAFLNMDCKKVRDIFGA